MNCMEISLRGYYFLKDLLKYLGGSVCPEDKKPHALPALILLRASGRAGKLSYLGSVSSEPHLQGHPLLHRYGWVSGHRNAFESGSPHFP